MDKSEIAALIMRDVKFVQIETELNVFCPFEAMGMIKQEIRHAHFLAYCLDPSRPHGFGDIFLRAFLTAAIDAQGEELSHGIDVLNIHLMNLENAIIRREWRDIDLVIEIPDSKFMMAVELKIDSSENKNQLSKYKNIVDHQYPDWNKYFLFLTKMGEAASEGRSDVWVSLGLDTLERSLRPLAARSSEFSGSFMLNSYLDMLRRRHLTNDRLEQIAADLWKRHRAALSFLADRQPNVLSDVVSSLLNERDSFAADLSREVGLEIVFDSNSGTSNARFAVRNWDEVEGVVGEANWTNSKRFILLEIARARDGFKAYLQLGRGDQLVRAKIYEKLKSGGAPINNPERFSSEWKRLNSRSVVLIKNEEDVEHDEILRLLKGNFMSFAKDILPKFDKALRRI